MVEGNSFTNLLKLIKQQGYNKDIKIFIGYVKSTSPLKISIGKIVISDGDFFKTETFSKATLNTNDLVLVLLDDSDFYLLDKVVQ